MVDKLVKRLDGRPIQTHPNCFYLSWEPPYTAIWTDIRSVKPKWSTTIKWKEMNGEIYIASDHAPTDRFSLCIQNKYKNKAMLKSHLQKAVRRSNKYKALKTAYHFLDLDQDDFLRRLSIIAIEDALPLQGISTIIWLQIAVSKGFILSDEHIAYIMGYLHDICICDKYEQVNHDAAKGIRDMRLLSLDPEGRTLVYSILIREAYGGLKGDIAMLKSSAHLWASRYHTKSEHTALLHRVPIFMTPLTVPLETGEWIIAAVDFHCCPQVISSLWERHDDIQHDDIQKAIWHCSSSLTNKKNIGIDFGQRKATPELLAIWNKIRRDFYSYGKFILEKNS